MIKRITLCAVIMLTGLGVGSSDAAPDLIAVRQAGFAMNGGDFAFIRSVVAAKGDVKALEVPARAIAKWAAVVPSLFPKGTETGGDTKALPEIWSDQAGFEKAAAAYGASAIKLANAAKAGDVDLVASETKVLGDACSSCHRAFRAK